MGVQIVLYNPNNLCLRKEQIRQVSHTMGKVDFSASLCYFDMTPSSQRLQEHEKIAGTIALIFVIEMLRLARCSWERASLFSDKLNGMLIEAN